MFVPTSKKKSKRHKATGALHVAQARRAGHAVATWDGHRFTITPGEFRGAVARDAAVAMPEYLAPDAPPFILISDETNPACAAHDVLGDLLDTERLPSFSARFGVPDERGGNCHDIALALLCDLSDASAARGWTWVVGHVGDDAIDHSWLEFDGWAVDASDSFFGIGRLVKFVGTPAYHELALARDVVVRDEGASNRWMEAFREGRLLRVRKEP